MKPLSIHEILITMDNLNMTSVIISESLVINAHKLNLRYLFFDKALKN